MLSVLLLARDRIANPAKNGSVRPAAWIVVGVNNDLMTRRLGEASAFDALGIQVAMAGLLAEVVGRNPFPNGEVIRLARESAETRRVTERGGRLIRLYRVFGVPIWDAEAAEVGKVAARVRQYRQCAEEATADMAMA